MTIGLALFTQISVGGSYVADLLPGFLAIGIGIAVRVRADHDRRARRRAARGGGPRVGPDQHVAADRRRARRRGARDDRERLDDGLARGGRRRCRRRSSTASRRRSSPARSSRPIGDRRRADDDPPRRARAGARRGARVRAPSARAQRGYSSVRRNVARRCDRGGARVERQEICVAGDENMADVAARESDQVLVVRDRGLPGLTGADGSSTTVPPTARRASTKAAASSELT